MILCPRFSEMGSGCKMRSTRNISCRCFKGGLVKSDIAFSERQIFDGALRILARESGSCRTLAVIPPNALLLRPGHLLSHGDPPQLRPTPAPAWDRDRFHRATFAAR